LRLTRTRYSASLISQTNDDQPSTAEGWWETTVIQLSSIASLTSLFSRGLFDDDDVWSSSAVKRPRLDPEIRVLERVITFPFNNFADMCCGGGKSIYGELQPASLKKLAKLLVSGVASSRFTLIDLG
jgi:hypothetical protein